MALSAGDKLGPYEIVTSIGKGGMGEVYRARDTRLGREVAIKVSAQRFGERFEREARVISSLNHPNICTLHDVGDNYLVMELVEGQTLSGRIKQGPIPLEEALQLAHQIADALEAAHDKGIVHRDLKPGNVMIKDDGSVKVLDFGLAKAGPRTASASEGDHPELSPTISMAATQAGVVLGTAAYMAPEQARGKPVDKRADIWAFGVVLYEMVTGQKLFKGEDLTETLAFVVTKDPDLGAAPVELRGALAACLEKDPKKRLRDIGDIWRLVEQGRADATRSVGTAQPVSDSSRPWPMLAAVALVAIVAGLGLGAWYFRTPAEPRPIVHFTSALPAAMIGPGPPVFSHDGSKLLFGNPATSQFYIRALDDPGAMPVAGTEGAQFGSFSPDDEWIAFTAPGEIRKVPVSGGAALTLYEGNVNGGTPIFWGEDDRIYYTAADGLHSISGAGGAHEVIIKPDPQAGELGFAAPQLLPGGEYVLVKVLTSAGLADFRVIAVNLGTGEKKTILDAAGDARFVPTGATPGVGHLVYGRNGSLYAVAFDARTLEAGPPVPVLQGIVGVAGLVYFGVSDTGTLAYISGTATNGLQTFTLSWVSRDGSEQAIPAPARTYQEIRISPDGGRIVGLVQDISQSITLDLWIYELERQTFTKITFGVLNLFPVWTADGKRLIHTNGDLLLPTLALQSTAADSSDESMEIWKDDEGFLPWSLSPEGFLIGNRPASPGDTTPGNQLMVLKLDPDGKSASGTLEPFLDARFLRSNPEFSPDGKWVAYQSNQTGRNEIYVVPYPGPGGIVQISNSGGTQPHWRGDGRELFFRNGDKMMAVDVEMSGSTLRALTPHELFEKASADYDVAADGKRFLMLTPDALTGSDTPDAELSFILNWDEELRRLVPLE